MARFPLAVVWGILTPLAAIGATVSGIDLGFIVSTLGCTACTLVQVCSKRSKRAKEGKRGQTRANEG